MITVSQLQSEIAELDQRIAEQRALVIEQRARLRELRQMRQYKQTLLRQLEEQGMQSLDTSWMRQNEPDSTSGDFGSG